MKTKKERKKPDVKKGDQPPTSKVEAKRREMEGRTFQGTPHGTEKHG